jgi:hypothetical protein
MPWKAGGTVAASFSHRFPRSGTTPVIHKECRGCLYDGLYSEYGLTWHKGFIGYSTAALSVLPRVTTETGWFTQGNYAISEDQQGKLFLNLFLAQYKRGWSYTFILC